MIGGTLVPDDIQGKVAHDAVACATQLDDLLVIEVNRKQATCDVHMFGTNPK